MAQKPNPETPDKVEHGSTLRDQPLAFQEIVDVLVERNVLATGWEFRIGAAGPGAVWVLFHETRKRYLAFPNDREITGPLLDKFIQIALADTPPSCSQVRLGDPYPGVAPACPVCGGGTFHRSTGWACLSILPGRK